MRETQYIIRDKMGFHAGPVSYFVKEAQRFPCSITITANGKSVDGKKLFAVMGLRALCGQELVLRAEGQQEEQAITALFACLKKNA